MSERLVERARAGEAAAFSELVDLHSDRCFAIAYRIVRDVERARDAVQQSFLLAWRELPQLRDPDRFEAWLYRLLLRECYLEHRRSRQWSDRVRVLDQDIQAPVGRSDFTVGVAERDALERAFSRLTGDHRAVMVLYHYAGMPLAAVSDIVGVPVGTVKSRLHHAARQLRAALDADSRAAITEEQLS